MRFICNLLTSSIGRKYLMAFTGLILVGFVAGHLVGNLQIFSPADKINGYAKFLHNMGPLLWVARAVIFGSLIVHVWAAVTLKLENRKARGPNAYAANNVIVATLASRTMVLTGLLVLAFLIFHLLQFTIGGLEPTFKANLPQYEMQGEYAVAGISVVVAKTMVDDVQSMMIFSFQKAWVSIAYIVAVGLLCFHLIHGIGSAFQTLGWRNQKWNCFLKGVATLFCIVYFFLNAAIPLSIMTGYVKLRDGVQAPVCASDNSSTVNK